MRYCITDWNSSTICHYVVKYTSRGGVRSFEGQFRLIHGMSCDLKIAGLLLSAPVFAFLGKLLFSIQEIALFAQIQFVNFLYHR